MNDFSETSVVFEIAQPSLFPIIEAGPDCERSFRTSLDRKCLLLHGDDFGLSTSVNEATIAALETGALSSASVMVPCARFGPVAACVAGHPEWDIGVHLTLTSEWKSYRWGPVTPPERVPSLVDGNGWFWPEPAVLAKRAKLNEVERELTSQMERALSAGIRPTHVDNHMFALFQNEGLYSVYRTIAHKYKIPFLAANGPNFGVHEAKNDEIFVDTMLTAHPEMLPTQWASAHIRSLRMMRPGVTQIIMHAGFDDPELRSIMGENSPWGSAWRQRDFDLITSCEFRDAVASNQIEIVNWRYIRGRS